MNNTTGSAIAMTLVPDEQRLDFWLNHFGSVKGWTTFEVVIFTTMGQFCDDYQGGIGNIAPYPMVALLFIPIYLKRH